MAHRGPRMVNLALALATAVACLFVLFTPGAGAVTLPPGFEQTTILPGVAKPQDVAIAPNGRVFVAEKSGLIRTFDNLDDTTPTSVRRTCARRCTTTAPAGSCRSWRTRASRRSRTCTSSTRSTPRSAARRRCTAGPGSFDSCAEGTRGGLDENCIVGSRISRLTVAGETMTLRAGAGRGLLPAVPGARRRRPRLRRGRQPVRDRRRRLDLRVLGLRPDGHPGEPVR